MAGRVPGLVAAAVVALAVSYLVPAGLGIVVWAGAFVLVGIAVWSVASGAALDGHRVLHRLGELTVIVIGETLVKLVLTASEHTVAAIHLTALVPILATLAAIWWAYFSVLSHSELASMARRRTWLVLHLPLHLALLGISVGLAKLLIDDPSLGKPFGIVGLIVAPVVLAFGILAAAAGAAGHRATRILVVGAVVMAVVSVGAASVLAPEPSAAVVAILGVGLAGAASIRRSNPSGSVAARSG